MRRAGTPDSGRVLPALLRRGTARERGELQHRVRGIAGLTDISTEAPRGFPLHAALFRGDDPILPRPGFVFRRTPRKIYFIGFNKTATSALFLLMMASGILSIHSSGNGKLFGRPQAEKEAIPHATEHMLANLEAGRPPAQGLEGYDAFMDLTVGPIDLCLRFEAFHEADPEGLFILNTRPMAEWETSRRKHRQSIRAAMAHYGLERSEVIRKWRRGYTEHHERARAYFAKNVPEQFLEWDIRSPATLLRDFLAPHGILIDPAYYIHVRETGGLFFPEPYIARACALTVPVLSAKSPS